MHPQEVVMEPPRVPCHSLIRSDAIIRKNKRSNDLETADLPVQHRDKMHKTDPTAESPPDSGGGEVVGITLLLLFSNVR